MYNFYKNLQHKNILYYNNELWEQSSILQNYCT
jgi:hypothetical protein